MGVETGRQWGGRKKKFREKIDAIWREKLRWEMGDNGVGDGR